MRESAAMEIHFIDLDLWEGTAERRIPTDFAQPFSMKDASGFEIAIHPSLTLHRELTVIGGDWIPVQRSGYSSMELMTMTPALHLGKSANIVREGENQFVAKVAASRRVDENALLVGGHPNHYMWLIGYLPRLLYALQADAVGPRKLLVNANLSATQRQTLELLGIAESRLLTVADDEAVTLPSVVVPSMLTNTTVCHPLLRKLLRAEFEPTPGLRARRVYLQRPDDAAPALANEAELVQLLARWGFEPQRVADLDFQGQVDLFSSAEAIVGVHDPLLANMLFCTPRIPVFEIVSAQHATSAMRMLAYVSRLKHVTIPSATEAPTDGNPLQGTWTVDLEGMESALRERFGAPG